LDRHPEATMMIRSETELDVQAIHDVTLGSIPEIVWLVFLFAAFGAGPPLLFVWLVRKAR
jgi:hypothetical protein